MEVCDDEHGNKGASNIVVNLYVLIMMMSIESHVLVERIGIITRIRLKNLFFMGYANDT